MTMHEHTEWTDRLSDYLDGELSDHEHRSVAAHVAGCVECSQALHELRAVVEHLLKACKKKSSAQQNSDFRTKSKPAAAQLEIE